MVSLSNHISIPKKSQSNDKILYIHVSSLMNLYILRHGIAAERGAEYLDDELRPLTDKGIRRMRREAKGMDAIGIAPDLIISSTLVRAIETAEIVQQGLSAPPRLITSGALVPSAHPSRIVQDLVDSHTALDNVMVVGHEPHMSSLVSYILTGRVSWLIDMKKGALVSIDLSPSGRGRLLWAMAPRQLRALA